MKNLLIGTLLFFSAYASANTSKLGNYQDWKCEMVYSINEEGGDMKFDLKDLFVHSSSNPSGQPVVDVTSTINKKIGLHLWITFTNGYVDFEVSDMDKRFFTQVDSEAKSAAIYAIAGDNYIVDLRCKR